MTYEEFNNFCRALPATSYVNQWGDSHVWKVGGKVFAVGGWEKSDKPVFTFKTSEFDFEILRNEPGFRPAPYMASRGMKWIQQFDAGENTDEALKFYFRESHRLVSLGLTNKSKRNSVSTRARHMPAQNNKVFAFTYRGISERQPVIRKIEILLPT